MWNWFFRTESAEPVYRCLLVSRRPLIRLGARAALSESAEFGVVGEADDVSTLTPVLNAPGPYILVLDLGLDRAEVGRPSGAGHDESRWLANHVAEIQRLSRRLPAGSAMVIVLPHNDVLAAGQTLAAGATACVTDAASADQFRAAVRAAAQRRLYLSPALTDAFLGTAGDTAFTRGLATLTEREGQVFRLIGQAHATADIALALRLTESTVITYQQRLCQKLGLRHAAELAYYSRVWLELHPESFDGRRAT